VYCKDSVSVATRGSCSFNSIARSDCVGLSELGRLRHVSPMAGRVCSIRQILVPFVFVAASSSSVREWGVVERTLLKRGRYIVQPVYRVS